MHPALRTPSRRLRQTRLLIVGFGDIGARIKTALPAHVRVLVTTSTPERVASLRMRQVLPIMANLDRRNELYRLASVAPHVLMLAPPPDHGLVDRRTQNLLAALRRMPPRTLVYASTTGVYGDREGAWVDETSSICPQTDRAKRRADAERRWRIFGQQTGTRVCVLRVPGIYAANRAGADPLERIRAGVPNLCSEDDVYVNHIHADTLAALCVKALWRGKAQRLYNVTEDCDCRLGDYYDSLADAAALPRQPRIPWEEAQRTLSPSRLSFLRQSRRVRNTRMRRELLREKIQK